MREQCGATPDQRCGGTEEHATGGPRHERAGKAAAGELADDRAGDGGGEDDAADALGGRA
ncbi:MAG: hypothetical protein LH616_05585 [Ilumatobacteraceae bacterium]|nr:hypothetical protein [Ilumatobacteraceae bacterium]